MLVVYILLSTSRPTSNQLHGGPRGDGGETTSSAATMQSGVGGQEAQQEAEHELVEVQAVKAPRGRTAYFIFAGEVRDSVKEAHKGECCKAFETAAQLSTVCSPSQEHLWGKWQRRLAFCGER